MLQQLRKKAAAWILLLAASTLLYIRLDVVNRGLQTYRWQPVPATVTATAVNDLGDRYSPLILYEYEFASQKHSSGQLDVTRLGFRFATEDEAEAFVARYPVGRELTAYVDPDAPDRAVIFRGVPWTSWMLAAVYVLLDLIAFRSLLRKPVEDVPDRDSPDEEREAATAVT